MKRQNPIKVYTIKEPQLNAYILSYEAFFEMEGPQADAEDCFPALYPLLDDASIIFYRLADVPDELCILKDEDSWSVTIKFNKANWDKIADILFPEKKMLYQSYVDYIKGDIVTIKAYAD